MRALNPLNSLRSLSSHPVFWVVLSLALVIVPHLSRFPAWSIVLIAILFLWRLLCIKYKNAFPPKWLLIILMIAASVGIFFHFGTFFGKTAGSVLLSTLLALKLHESQTRRDFMIIIALSFFIIVTNLLFSQSIQTVVFMLVIIVILIMSMISINQDDAAYGNKQRFKLATNMLLQSIPLMLVLFVLFPRISGTLWKLPEEKQTATTGLSDVMSPGKISNLSKSNAVAFRAEFINKTPQQHQLYWRSLVLWHFDGQTWVKGYRNRSPQPAIHVESAPIFYTITMEAHQKYWLYALDMPVNVPDSIRYTNNFVLHAKNKITSVYQYSISSTLNYITQQNLSDWEKTAGMKTPPNTNPQTIQLGKQLAQQFDSPDEIIKHVLSLFNQQNYHYTLNPPLTPGFHPVDQFLFETKSGFCEHYASSFALLMRAAGIPSRIVLGYQGGTVNPLNKIMTVRQSDAHAWTEVWIKNRGWVRVDPTAAIAPQRIESNLDAALGPDEIRPFHMQMNSNFIRNMRFYWDAVDNQWNLWVVGYDEQRQLELLNSIMSLNIKFTEIIILMVVSFSLLLILISLMIIKPWHKEKLDPVVEMYNKFCHKLATTGIQREIYEGPVDFSDRAGKHLPEQKNKIKLITRLYTKLRYEASHNQKQIAQFRQHIKEFKPDKK